MNDQGSQEIMSELKEQEEMDEMVGEKFLQGHQDAAMFPQGSIADLEENIETVSKTFADGENANRFIAQL